MYCVSIELEKHEWKFRRTRTAVGARAAGKLGESPDCINDFWSCFILCILQFTITLTASVIKYDVESAGVRSCPLEPFGWRTAN